MSFAKFRDLSIATKLNLVQAAIIVALFAISTVALVSWLSAVYEREGIDELKMANRQAVDMVQTIRVASEKEAERLIRTLESYFKGEFALHDGETAEVAGVKTPVLTLNGRMLNNSLAAVDEFSATTTANATVFVRQGDDFVRIATSVKKQDGTRAMGTKLAADHPARQLILAGKSYAGKATLFGKDYMTYYKPIVNAANQVVGILYLGLDFGEQLADVKNKLKAIKLYETGYIFGIDAGANKGELVIHPTEEGRSLWDSVDANGVYYVREMVEKKEGILYYDFPKVGESEESQKIATFMYIPEWNWVIATSIYQDEFLTNVHTMRNHLILGAVALGFLLCLTIFFASQNWVSRPLLAAVKAMQRIASGDLTVAIEPRGNDEVGRLLAATNKMSDDMRTTLSDIQSTAYTLVESAGQLANSAQQAATHSEAQSDAASAMAASVEEMSANIKHVADNASNARHISTDSGEASTQGAEVIGQAVASMTRIAETVRFASTQVTALGQESKAISEIVNVIREIADQTNLLALNAAIEAARAGEQGRGFAVVADEVRKLAERTSTSTQEIGTLIGRIQAETEGAVTSMGNGVQQVEEGLGFAENAGSSIANIRDSAGQVNTAVTSISHALDEQTVAIGDIANNVEKIAGMADSNKGIAIQSAEQAAELEKLAERLRTRVAKFKI
ncbi:MAG: methyl-accepting chemotaxis protein [Azonexus sp.]|jgi:methyl-accepting chemotaxis protein-2 (aspartate sensor receptor)|nr:methyl-accepting chemotaxis protein [Azonexus sp.]